ncbi:DUF124-domain-containing protein [Stereum hirsutum FP-91666 SS1]|uniref:DUF124-domain-containing protein n=1 Tax=Stereum hirsutum (strain FP-91666) TaxID=721885 RepID=UPI000440F9AF|nr:DUF124-domain-containing protein [Stereum hirsutum FP-91666 SS1]EIM89546.1 DUF124-domain-containing protein [Stereum hirsutum FP-91666 SS1]
MPTPQHHQASTFSQAPLRHGDTHDVETTGVFQGGKYKIDHRDSNTLLSVTLQPEAQIKVKPGAMLAMDPTMQIQGKVPHMQHHSFSKFFSGEEASESIFTGPGEVLIAPEVWGDIVPITLDGQAPWSVSKYAFLASTSGLVRGVRSQGFAKGLFSGEGFFVSEISGQGTLWVQAIGAIVQRHLRPGEEWIVDNGHLVAWSAQYKVETIKAKGGLLSKLHTDEGKVCRFTGPGTVYIQTRNPDTLIGWITAEQSARAGN